MAGLYIHIPFCVRKCDYCDFVSFADSSDMDAYTAALQGEFALRAAAVSNIRFDTVFIGGGTPSALPLGCVGRILGAARECFDIAEGAEMTIECNPGTADRAKFDEYRSAGVNRLSLGVQSLDDGLLKAIGRIHMARDFFLTLDMARAAGFDNVNADIMYGLPKQTCESLTETIDGVAGAGVEHISAYSLILEEGTPLFSRVNAGQCELPDEDAAYLLHRTAVERITGHGYTRYEISNYAKEGRECRHNLNYWDCGEYLGVGLAAHSALNGVSGLVRSFNTSSLKEYIAAVKTGKTPQEGAEEISRDDGMFEYIMLGLRRIEGVSLCGFRERFGERAEILYASALEKLREYGWLRPLSGRIALNDTGLDMQNAALLLFMDG